MDEIKRTREELWSRIKAGDLPEPTASAARLLCASLYAIEESPGPAILRGFVVEDYARFMVRMKQ